MNKQATALLCLALVAGLSASAKIWRVNNMPGVTADFTTAQAAHDGANAGDTIHLEASTNNYGAVTCTKQLTWIGLGEWLSANPGRQAGSQAFMSTVTLNAGSTGSKFTGLSIQASVNIYVTDVVLQRNFIANSIGLGAGVSNVVIEQNAVWFGINVSDCANAIVKNNIIGYSVTNSPAGAAIVTNNTMGAYSASGGALYNTVFQNNILKGNPLDFINSQVSYNLTSSASGMPAGNNNQFNINMADVFVNDGFWYQSRVDKDFVLKPGSPAIGAGAAGADCGAFGGDQPYVLALQPAIPAITAMGSPVQLNANTIQVTFSAKSNN